MSKTIVLNSSVTKYTAANGETTCKVAVPKADVPQLTTEEVVSRTVLGAGIGGLPGFIATAVPLMGAGGLVTGAIGGWGGYSDAKNENKSIAQRNAMAARMTKDAFEDVKDMGCDPATTTTKIE